MNFGEILLKLLERTSDLHLFLEGGLDLDMSCHWGLLKNEWLQHTKTTIDCHLMMKMMISQWI